MVRDWGEGCVDEGFLRKGKIHISGRITSTSVRTTTEFDNFEENGNKISSGTLNFDAEKTNIGWDANIEVENIEGVVENESYSMDFNLSISTDARGTQYDDSDDLITLTGNGEFSSDKGSISIKIDGVKIDNEECEYPISGSVEIEIDSDEADGTIKFSFHEECDGNVDVEADLKIDGSSLKVNTSVPMEE